MFAMGPGFFRAANAPSYDTLAITGTFPGATVGVAYDEFVTISGGETPYTLTAGTGVASGSLPAGLSLSIENTDELHLSGTPTAAATSNFTVSVDSGDGQTAMSAQSVVVSLATVAGLHFDGADGSTAFTDVSGKTWTRNGTTTALSTAVKKFGTASLRVGSTTGSATNNGITTPDHADFHFGTGEWTISWWQYFTTLDSYQTAFARGSASGSGRVMAQTGNGNGKMVAIVDGLNLASGISAAINTQVYYEICRQKNYLGGGDDAFLFYQDGQIVSSVVGINPTSSPMDYVGPTCVGAYADGTYATAGYIDDFQALKGTCVHRDGVTFTPPAAPFSP